jgi:hypothetical protein
MRTAITQRRQRRKVPDGLLGLIGGTVAIDNERLGGTITMYLPRYFPLLQSSQMDLFSRSTSGSNKPIRYGHD